MKASDRRFVIYANGHRAPDVYSRSYVPVFSTAHAARAWLEQFLARHEYERDGNVIRLRTDFDIRLRSEQLDAILAAPLSNEPVDAEHKQWILRFKYGTWDEVHVKDESVTSDGETVPTTRTPRPVRERRADAPPSYITISALCAGSNVLPTHARAALRASGRIKPAYGWSFAPSEIDDIKRLCGLK